MDTGTGHNTTILKRRESAGNTAKSMYNLCISLLFTWTIYYQKQSNSYKPLQILPYFCQYYYMALSRWNAFICNLYFIYSSTVLTEPPKLELTPFVFPSVSNLRHLLPQCIPCLKLTKSKGHATCVSHMSPACHVSPTSLKQQLGVSVLHRKNSIRVLRG